MKKIVYAVIGLAIFASACKKDLEVQKPLITNPSGLDTLVGTISVNTTVTKNTYLYGLVYVAPGVTLTINPGVTIYGSSSTTAPGVIFDSVNLYKNKGILLVQTGAKLIAQGTLGHPIIWTSDNKIPVGSRAFGDWGGVLLLGKATFHNAAGNTTTTRFEAFDIVPNDLRNFYGGNDDNDNSGIMTYNRLEFGGGLVTIINKEINGLTLCAVGRGTTINHVEILKSGDDGVEFFGGAVNIDHFLVYAAKDDDFDFDEGYHGNLQFIVSYRDTTADNSGSHNIEADNDANATNFTPYTSPLIANATLIGPTSPRPFSADANHYFDGTVLARRNVSLRLVNSYVMGQAQPYGLVYTPTTGVNGALLLDPPSLATPGNVQGFNIYQTNNPGFGGIAVQSTIEGNPVPAGLTNNSTLVAKLTSANNANNAVNALSDLNLGGTLENTASTPFLHTGVNLNALGLTQFVGTDERGGVISTDNWTAAGVSVGTPWISIAVN